MSEKTPHPDAGADIRRETVRDLGFERVWIEWMPGESGMFATLMVEDMGSTERVLSVERNEIDHMIDVLEQAKDELPGEDEEGPYV